MKSISYNKIQCFCLALSMFPWSVFSSLSISVEPEHEKCIAIMLPIGGAHISGSYDMLDDDLPASPLSVTLFDSNNHVLYHNRVGVPEGHFSIRDAHGKHYFCVGNGHAHYKYDDIYRTDKDNERFVKYMDHSHDDDGVDVNNRDGKTRNVGFTIRVGETAHNLLKKHGKEQLTGPTAELLKEVTQLSHELVDQIDDFLDHEEYMKDRDNVHNEFLDATISLLFRWTILEALALITISVGQVLYFRKFFESRRYI